METNVENFVKKVLQEIVYPIGHPYITQDKTNPATILGFGTWERTEGEVLVGVKDGDAELGTIGNRVGSKTMTLTIANIPAHKHWLGGSIRRYVNGSEAGTHKWPADGTQNSAREETWTRETGNGTPFSVLQPTRVVGYMWIRTA